MKHLFIILHLLFVGSKLRAQSWSHVATKNSEQVIDLVPNQFFGSKVAIDGNYAVISAPGLVPNDTLGQSIYAYVLFYNGTNWTIQAKLSPSIYGNFGNSVAISGDNIVIGGCDAHYNNETYSGVAFVYTKPVTGWVDATETAILTPSDHNYYRRFGYSVDIDGDNIVIGAPISESSLDIGRAYVYTKPTGGWVNTTETAKLLCTSSSVGDKFGWSVAIKNDNIVVGAHLNDLFSNNAGSLFVYTKSTGNWVDMYETCNLSSTNIAPNDQFGYSVDISDNAIIAGAPKNDLNGTNTGTSYVFSMPASGWVNMTQTGVLSANPSTNEDQFGNSVSISGNTILVNAQNAITGSVRSGSSYVFEKITSAWSDANQTAKIDASDRYGNDLFGYSGAIMADKIIIGAVLDDDQGTNSGSAYFFEKPITGWIDTVETEKITTEYRYFTDLDQCINCEVSIDGDYAVIGSRWSSENDQGAAYVLYFNGTNWLKIATLTASDAMQDDLFGRSVAISGNTIVIGSSRMFAGSLDTTGVGAAYVFTKPTSGWKNMTETARLSRTSAPLPENYYFGYSVSISEQYIIVGSPVEGAAYLFERPSNGWVSMTETAKLTPVESSTAYFFGVSCDISNDQILIGSMAAAAYVFEKPSTGWTDMNEQGKLTCTPNNNSSDFGQNIAISNNDIIIGSIYSQAGFVYTKPPGGWVSMTETAKLTRSFPSVFSGGDINFGWSVAIKDSIIVIGSTIQFYDSVWKNGVAYIYTKPENGWIDATESTKILNPINFSFSNTFTQSLDISDEYIVITTASDLTSDYAYLYKRCSPSFDTISVTSCFQYISPSGRHIWNESGTYRDSLLSITGCDSVLTIHLIIHSINSLVNADTISLISNENTAGTTYQWIDCDNNNAIIVDAVNQNYFPTTEEGHFSVILSLNGCVDTSACTLFMTCYTTYSTKYIYDCPGYFSPSGNYNYTVSGIYTDTIPNYIGCDSVITIHFYAITVISSVSYTDEQISSNAANALYQWIDCENNNIIDGATSPIYFPSENGSYAVIVTQYNCIDTSICITMNAVGLPDISYEAVTILPNFTVDGKITINTNNWIKKIEILDLTGRTISTITTINQKGVLDLGMFSSGNYLLRIETDDAIYLKKVYHQSDY